jgi:hypothetical protein
LPPLGAGAGWRPQGRLESLIFFVLPPPVLLLEHQ